MTDLEITRLCAEAMGYIPSKKIFWNQHCIPAVQMFIVCDVGDCKQIDFQPLCNDAQARALVKKFDLRISRMGGDNEGDWSAVFDEPTGHGWKQTGKYAGFAEDLNRAICECVAKMQSQKPGSRQA